MWKLISMEYRSGNGTTLCLLEPTLDTNPKLPLDNETYWRHKRVKLRTASDTWKYTSAVDCFKTVSKGRHLAKKTYTN